MNYSTTAATLVIAASLGACGSGVEQTVLTANDPISEKAVYTTAPVYRFAKSNGAYFYTGSAVEAEQIRLNYPDFRYEGVAFNQVTSGNGQRVFRFANLVNGGYFYTASVAEKDFVLNDPVYKLRFRLDDAGFFVAPDNDPLAYPVYRAANRANGAYLYTLSQPEISYAVNVIGTWNDEGLKFRVPNVPTVNASWPITSFTSYSVLGSFGSADANPATVNETDTFAVGSNRYKITKTATGCTTAQAGVGCNQLLGGNLVEICVNRADQNVAGLAPTRHVLVSAAASPASVSEILGKTFRFYDDCGATPADITFNLDGTITDPSGVFYSAFDVAAVFSAAGFTDSSGSTVLRPYKVDVNGQVRYFIVEIDNDPGETTNSYLSMMIQQ
jgi:Repeat of unknown function (DUF5648)